MSFFIKQRFQAESGVTKFQEKALGEHLPWGTLPGRIPLSELKPVEKLTLSKRSQMKSLMASAAEKEISTSETEHLGFYSLSLPLVKYISQRNLKQKTYEHYSRYFTLVLTFKDKGKT